MLNTAPHERQTICLAPVTIILVLAQPLYARLLVLAFEVGPHQSDSAEQRSDLRCPPGQPELQNRDRFPQRVSRLPPPLRHRGVTGDSTSRSTSPALDEEVARSAWYEPGRAGHVRSFGPATLSALVSYRRKTFSLVVQLLRSLARRALREPLGGLVTRLRLSAFVPVTWVQPFLGIERLRIGRRSGPRTLSWRAFLFEVHRADCVFEPEEPFGKVTKSVTKTPLTS